MYLAKPSETSQLAAQLAAQLAVYSCLCAAGSVQLAVQRGEQVAAEARARGVQEAHEEEGQEPPPRPAA